MKGLTIAGLLLLLSVTAALAQGGVYARGADGKWRAIPAQSTQGRVSLSLKPAEAAGGKAIIVVNKPSWMVLEDHKAPVLKALKINDMPHEASAGLVLSGPAKLSFTVADDLNPIDVKNLRFTATPQLPPLKINAASLKPPAKSGTFTVELPALAPGFYHATLTVPDLSPQGNELSVSLPISVPGATLSADRQTVRIAARGAGYTLSNAPQSFLRVGDDDPSMYLTSQIAGEFLYIRQITDFAALAPTTQGALTYRLTATAGTSEGKETKAKAELQFDLEVRPDLPCLFVTGRTINRTADENETYCFWGWLPGKGFATDRGLQEWKSQYTDIGPVKWVFLPALEPGKPGVGIISPLCFGESRFNTLLLYTTPRKIPTKLGDAVKTPFAIMPAKSASEVQALVPMVWAAAGWGQK